MSAAPPGPVVEVFADVFCPFTHVGLRRLVARRAELGRDDVRLWVRSWPLEVVNGEPMDAHFIAEEVDEIRAQVAPDLFAGFTESAFPASSLPALALTERAYRRGAEVGEAVALEVRDLLFEQGVDVSDPGVLAAVAARHGLVDADAGTDAVLADHAEGGARGVIGSPHFFVPGGGFFCPSLDVGRDESGHLRITADPDGFDAFVTAALA